MADLTRHSADNDASKTKPNPLRKIRSPVCLGLGLGDDAFMLNHTHEKYIYFVSLKKHATFCLLAILSKKSLMSKRPREGDRGLMKNKIAFLSLAFGSIVFILVFVLQAFVRLYSRVINMEGFYRSAAIFLFLYWLFFVLLLWRWKKVHKLFVYVGLPIILSFATYVYSELTVNGLVGFDGLFFFFIYLIAGHWSVGLFGGILDVVLTRCYERRVRARK